MNPIDTVLLGLLAQGEAYGYQLERLLHQPALGLWTAEVPTDIYPALQALAAQGLVEQAGAVASAGSPKRLRYRLSVAGQNALQAALRAAWQPAPLAPASEDLAALMLRLLPPSELEAGLRGRLAALQGELDALEEADAARSADPAWGATWRAVAEHARLRLATEITWTEQLLGDLAAGVYAAAAAAPTNAARPSHRRAQRTAQGVGAFTFVLHTHLPYCRMAGRWPHGEEWLHEALAETYIPLLNSLYDLRAEGVDYTLTISLTPILTEQLADLDVRAHFVEYLDAEIASAEADIPRFGVVGEAHREYLAGWYRDFYTAIKTDFLERYGGDVVAAFRQLQDEGYLEIITCAATHGYLPLLGRDSSIYGQLRAGVESYRRHFGRAPRAIWLPECAYRPAYTDTSGVTRPAIEEFLAPLGLTCFFVETHAIEGGRPVGKAAGEVAIGPYPAIQRRYVIPPAAAAAPGGTTFSAYYVVGNVGGPTDPPVAAIGRNNRTGQQVWSADFGYPGDADYREFHKKDDQSGNQYWRVTGPRVDLGAKDYYHPDWAAARVGEHAQHYVALVESLLQGYAHAHGRYGLISANYDTELFGHWWFEGIAWIGEVLRGLAASQTVDLTTASDYVRDHAPDEVIALPESSWGAGGNHWTWDNPDTSWMWEPIHAAEEGMERLAAAHPQPTADERLALDQAARELLLLESSDWPFLVTTGQAREYAEERFRSHVARFRELADLLETGLADRAAQRARELYELDKVFPDADYRWFAERQGRADGYSAG